MTQPNDPRHWATVAHQQHPTWSVKRLADHALDLFLEYRHWKIKCVRFLRAEDKFAGMFPGSACLETATVNTGNGELTRTYIECFNCQSNLSTRISIWFVDRFLPAHPEWREPDPDALRAEIEWMKQPQMAITALRPRPGCVRREHKRRG